MSILRRQFNLTGESSSSKSYRNSAVSTDLANRLIGPCAENDTEMLADIAEANDLSVEITNNVPQIDAIEDVAERAEDAGNVFVAAADTIEAGGDVSEAAIAQADSTVVGAIEDAGEAPTEVIDSIDDSERITVVGESANGTFKFKSGYSSLRRDPVALRLAGESAITWAKEKFSNAMTAAINLYEKLCQWIGKYIGTFPNLASNAKKMRERAKKITGKRQENTTAPISGSTALTLTISTNGSKPVYIKDYESASGYLEGIKKLNLAFIDLIRSANDTETSMVDTFGNLDFDQDINAACTLVKTTWDNLIKSCEETQTAATEAGSNIKGWTASNDWKIEGAESIASLLKCTVVFPLPKFRYLTITLPDGGKLGFGENTGKDYVDAVTAGKDKAAIKTAGTALAGKLEVMSNALDKIGASGNVDAKPSGKTVNINAEWDTKLYTSGQVEEICNTLVNVMDDWISFRNSKRYIKHLENMRKVEKSVKKAEARFNNTQNRRNDDADVARPDVVNKCNKFIMSATKHTSKQSLILRDLATEYVSFYNALLTVCGKSLDAYVAND